MVVQRLLPGQAADGREAAEFCAAIAADELRVIEATPHDCRRIAELLATYASLRLQVVDPCIVALAGRLDLREVAALDRRDFLVIPPAPAERWAADLAPRRLSQQRSARGRWRLAADPGRG